MPTASLTISGSIGGIAIQGNAQRSAEGQQSHEVSLPVAKSGSLSTRASDTAGTLTLGTGHGITDGQVLDIYWTDANGDLQVAYGATVGTVAGTSVPFTGAAGTNLPTQGSTVTAGVVSEVNADFDGDDLEILAIQSNRNAHVRFVDSGAELLKAQKLIAGEPWAWIAGQGNALPITGNPVDTIKVSNGDATAAATLKIGLLYDTMA